MEAEVLKVRYLIVGAGPAGLQLAYFLQQRGADYVVLERASIAAAFYDKYPRQRRLISINKRFTGSQDPEFNMRHDWNSLLTNDHSHLFRDYDKDYYPSADSLVRYLNDFAEKYALKVRYNMDVTAVEKAGEGYRARTSDGQCVEGEVLVVATGFDAPLIPNIPGIEHSENYIDVSTEVDDFADQRVLILGKSNSGFEIANHLASTAAVIHLASSHSIRMAWKTHYVGHLRAINNTILDSYQLKSQNAVIDADVKAIDKLDDGTYQVTFAYKHAEGEVETLNYDRVICCTGFRLNEKIFTEEVMPELTRAGKYPLLTSQWESTSQDRMYFAGTLTHSRDYHKTTSAFIHGFRYNARALDEFLAMRFDGQALKQECSISNPQAIAEYVLGRVNRSGGLWQQPGFIADWFTYDNGDLTYGKELPLDYIRESMGQDGRPVYTVTLEYGDPIVGDPFAVERIHRENADEAPRSQFLHPIVREFRDGELISEHHVIEDLESKWVEPVHIDPLVEYLVAAFEAAAYSPQVSAGGA